MSRGALAPEVRKVWVINNVPNTFPAYFDISDHHGRPVIPASILGRESREAPAGLNAVDSRWLGGLWGRLSSLPIRGRQAGKPAPHTLKSTALPGGLPPPTGPASQEEG
jgi:hypothetical protein